MKVLPTSRENRMLCFVAAFCSVFILLGVWLTARAGWTILEGVRAGSWPHTTGTILSVRSKDTSDGDGESRQVLVRYSYSVAGREFEGDTIHPTYSNSNYEDTHERLEQLLRPGTKVRVYYREDAPERSTLSVGFYSVTLFPLFGGITFAVVGVCFLLVAWFAVAGNRDYAAGVTVIP